MTHQVRRASGAVVILLVMAAAGARAQQSPPVSFLDVPYISQSEALCGGAAAAMVMRYWGASGINAETFSSLVDAKAGGIRGADLLADLRARGWDARSFAADAELIAARLRDRQPVVALIEDRPGIFHYVVVVAWANGRVFLHDPARAPFRVVAADAFERAWEKSGRWTMLLLPGTPTATAAPPVPATAPATAPSACDAIVAEAVRRVESKDADAAIAMLRGASDLCPDDPAPPRELAGVFALQDKWPEATALASEAVRRNPRDEHAWRIVATGNFMQGHTTRALAAWNRVQEPVLDIVNIRGLRHTRYAAALDAMRLRTERVLDVRDLTAATRRLSELPAAQFASVSYRPLANGRAAVDAAVVERSRFPVSAASLAAIGVRAVSDREAAAAVANPTGAGDALSLAWRWWEPRPRIAAAYATPSPVGGGVLRVEIFGEEQSYAGVTPSAVLREKRRGGSVALSDWTARGFRWDAGLGVDRWSPGVRTMTATAAIERRFAEDRTSVQANAIALTGGLRTAGFGASAGWRSSIRNEGSVLLVRAGADWVGAAAPLALWPGAGTGHARAAVLRAHPLLDDGIITGDVFGRRLTYASWEARRWVRVLKVARIAPAVFIDTARADRRRQQGSAWHADAGAGLRVAFPGSGVFRMDIAKGLRDGATALSIGWTR